MCKPPHKSFSSFVYKCDNKLQVPKARCTLAKNGTVTQTYTYNANGNRIGDNISYTLEDQLEQIGDTIYAYDEDGYLTSKVNLLEEHIIITAH